MQFDKWDDHELYLQLPTVNSQFAHTIKINYPLCTIVLSKLTLTFSTSDQNSKIKRPKNNIIKSRKRLWYGNDQTQFIQSLIWRDTAVSCLLATEATPIEVEKSIEIFNFLNFSLMEY